MLADSRPFCEILGNPCTEFVAVLNGRTESVENLCTCRKCCRYVLVCRLKDIVFGICFIRIEVLENSVYINGMLSAVSAVKSRIVSSCVRNPCSSVKLLVSSCLVAP